MLTFLRGQKVSACEGVLNASFLTWLFFVFFCSEYGFICRMFSLKTMFLLKGRPGICQSTGMCCSYLIKLLDSCTIPFVWSSNYDLISFRTCSRVRSVPSNFVLVCSLFSFQLLIMWHLFLFVFCILVETCRNLLQFESSDFLCRSSLWAYPTFPSIVLLYHNLRVWFNDS